MCCSENRHQEGESTMKIQKMIPLVLMLSMILDYMDGDFSNPSIFDIVKWTAWLVCLACYVYCVRRNREA